jgi:predicted DNA-binding transcriptional regulator AlpA
MHALPEVGFLRLKGIIGDPKADPPIPAIVPVSKTSWYQGIREGRYPQPTHALGRNTSAWTVESIRELIERSAPIRAANDPADADPTWKRSLHKRTAGGQP